MVLCFHGFVLILRQERTQKFKKLKIYIKMYPSSLWQRTTVARSTVIQWDVLVDGPPHNGGTPSAVQVHAYFPTNVLLFNAFLFVHSLQPFRWQRWAGGSTGYHRLTEDSMLMKPGFLRSSQYKLLETHLSLWLVSTTFLEEKGHIPVLVFCPAYL